MIKNKKLVIFDLDGTLAVSKSTIDVEMSLLLVKLLENKDVAVISGGSYKQFQKQFLASLKCPQHLAKRLYLFPTCSTSFYKFNGNDWESVYEEKMSEEEKNKIIEAFKKALPEAGYIYQENPFGEIIEDRITQITFSALGQQAPIELKEKWDSDNKKRLIIKEILENYISEFEIRIGGTTSIDVTRKGIDKAYGINQIEKYLKINKDEMIFIGDALFEGGNDYPVKSTGVYCIQVSGPEECKEVIKNFIQELASF